MYQYEEVSIVVIRISENDIITSSDGGIDYENENLGWN